MRIRTHGARIVLAGALSAVLAAGCNDSTTADVVKPALFTATQNRGVDPNGQTVDLAFSERINASSASNPALFTSSGGQTSLAAWAVGSGSTIRVLLDAPVVPGTDTFAVAGVADMTGNAIVPVAAQAVASTDTIAPFVQTSTAETFANAANDHLMITFGDDMIGADAENPVNYQFEHPTGTPVSLAACDLRYDESTRSLEILFSAIGAPAVNLQTGGTWQLLVSNVRDLGANSIGVGILTSGTVTGDVAVPAVAAATQNLVVDPTGATVDVSFGEVLDPVSGTSGLNYVASGGQSTFAATILWPGDMVRVRFDAAVVPGADTLQVQNVLDLAGNQMTALPAQPVAATDSTPPSVSTAGTTAVSGYENDRIIASFDEEVLPLEAGNLANYAFESPTGTPVSLAGSLLAYDPLTQTATIVLTGGSTVNVQTGATFTLTATGIRDVAGNTIGAGGVFAGTVGGDATSPTVAAITQNLGFDPYGHTVDVLFSEPVDLANSPGASFVASGGQTLILGDTLADSMIVRLAFDDVIVPGTTTLNVTAVEDPAGNVGAALGPLPVGTSDLTAPVISGSTAATVSGVANDALTLTFGEQVIPGDAETPGNWAFESPTGTPVLLTGASFAYDAPTRTVTIGLPNGTNLATGDTYTLFVSSVRDAAGNAMGAGVPSAGTITGDTTAPLLVVADRNELVDVGDRTVDVTFDEALDPVTAQTALNYTVTGVGAPGVESATLLLDGATVRLYLTAAVTPGTHLLDVSGVEDLAGRLMTPVVGQAIAP